MDQLQAFLKRYGRRRNARCWLGPRPQVRTKALPRAIASMVGLPTSHDGWTEKQDLRPVDRKRAARVLALVATESLTYGRHVPRESYQKLAEAALGEFADDAVFLTNLAEGGEGFQLFLAKLTNATLDAGLISYDVNNALIFWVEDED